jgi:tetratricopeptide (TPR) repeat protein
VIRTTLLAICCTLLASSAFADRIAYLRGTGAERAPQIVDEVTITAWNAATVTYRNKENRQFSVSARDVISIDRRGGSMSRDMAQAMDAMGRDAQAARAALRRVAEQGNALDKEQAQWLLAQLALEDAQADPARRPAAIAAVQGYTRAYAGGYFARDAWRSLSDLQRAARQVDAARETLRAMGQASAALVREAHQLTGELEASQGRWEPAIAAFRAAEQAAAGDRNAEYLARAWRAWSLKENKQGNEARALVDQITGDESFEDPESLEDELALAIAFPVLGDLLYEAGSVERAYDAYIKGAYYAWWSGASREGYCLGRAFLCARNLEATGEVWRGRREALHRALQQGFPRELRAIEQAARE